MIDSSVTSELPIHQPARTAAHKRQQVVLAAAPVSAVRAWALPVALGVLLGLASALLVVVQLGQPAWTSRFTGIRFSNAINSPGARHAVALFRYHLDWLPGPSAGNPLSPGEYVTGVRIALASMFALQICALIACRNLIWASPWKWTIGPAIAAAVFMLYPPTATDIFAYASFGWVAEQGGNPYLTPPEAVPGDPYAQYNDWTHITTPYGPIWTGLSHALVRLTGSDPFWTAIAFKVIATLAAFGLAAVCYQLAKRFTDDPRLTTTAFVLVLWSPILLLESAGPVHLDAVMMLLATTGLLVATGTRFESFRLGLLLVVASALIKPATLPLVAIMALVRFTRNEPLGTILRRVTLDAAAAVALAVAGFSVYWDGGVIEAASAMAREVFIERPLRSNPLWIWAFAGIDSAIGFTSAIDLDLVAAARWVGPAIGALVLATFGWSLYRQRQRSLSNEADITRSTLWFLVWTWAATTVVLGLLPVNAHPWYVIWTLTPLALIWISDGVRARPRPPIWLLAIHGWIILLFMVHHTLPRG